MDITIVQQKEEIKEDACSTENISHNTIHWFRKGLRLHDNLPLLHALKTSKKVYPVYIFDIEWTKKHDNVGFNRTIFLLACLADLKKKLQQLGSDLYILCGRTLDVLSKKVLEWNITQLTYMYDIEIFYRNRDEKVMNALESLGVITVVKSGHTLYNIEEILKKNGGSPPLTYKRFLSVLFQLKDPAKPAETIAKDHFKNCLTPPIPEDDVTYQLPTMVKLGFTQPDNTTPVWEGGETAALKRLNQRFLEQGWLDGKPRRTKQNILLPTTTGLSPYFNFGCISPRYFFHRLASVKFANQKDILPPVSLQGQILWRDFFYTVAGYTPNFTRIKDNPICLQIHWYENEEHLQAWKDGKTGYPWIDAIMRQLNQEGWVHHLARHAVACFLTRGNLWLSWEKGQEYFEEKLVDADYSMNAGNWMWLSASAFCHNYTRVFHPVCFGKRVDPYGEYVKRYVPELRNFPLRYIYEPWKASIEVQTKANCIIGKEYPHPIVEHTKVWKKNMKMMTEIRDLQKHTVALTDDKSLVPQVLPPPLPTSDRKELLINVQIPVDIDKSLIETQIITK